MSKKQLFALFACNLITLIVGNGLLGLLPVYATRLGADATKTGYYLSLAFLGLATGSMVSGWLSDRLQRRKILLVASGLCAAPVIWLIGRTTTFEQLALLTAIVWFCAGVGVTVISTLTGLFANAAERGWIFGIIGLTPALGGIIGGAASGAIVDRWGYPTLFTMDALLFACQPLVALLLKDHSPLPASGEKEKHEETIGFSPGEGSTKGSINSRTFWLLFAASTLVFLSNAATTLARPLIMDGLHFDATAISSTVLVSGLMTLPLPLLLGWLSDRFGRKFLLMALYFCSVVGTALLIGAVLLWHFWVAASLMATVSVSIFLGSALVTDLVPQRVLGTALALFAATNWLGYIVGFASMGAAIQNFGMTVTLGVGVMLALFATVLVIPLRQPKVGAV